MEKTIKLYEEALVNLEKLVKDSPKVRQELRKDKSDEGLDKTGDFSICISDLNQVIHMLEIYTRSGEVTDVDRIRADQFSVLSDILERPCKNLKEFKGLYEEVGVDGLDYVWELQKRVSSTGDNQSNIF